MCHSGNLAAAPVAASLGFVSVEFRFEERRIHLNAGAIGTTLRKVKDGMGVLAIQSDMTWKSQEGAPGDSRSRAERGDAHVRVHCRKLHSFEERASSDLLDVKEDPSETFGGPAPLTCPGLVCFNLRVTPA